MRKLIAGAIALLSFCAYPAVAQNIENQVIASQFGQFKLYGTLQTGFTFSPAACQVSAGGKNFGAFSPGVPVRVVDLDTPSLSETVNAGVVNITACAVTLPVVNPHNGSFYLTSGSAGLQEAINANGPGSGPNTVILDNAWYNLGGTGAIISAAKGYSNIGLVDITTTPYTWYAWSGSAYAVVPVGGGSPGGGIGAFQYSAGSSFAGAVINGLVKGNGASAPTAAIPGTDYQPPLGYTPLNPSNNLSDVGNEATARSNLGAQASLGYTPLNPANNLSDVQSESAARANLGAQATLGYTPVPNTTTVNGNALSSNVQISASQINTGTLPHAQLPALQSGDIPNNAASTTGNAAGLSGTPALPNGTTATTQSCASSANVATDAYVANCGTGGSLPTAAAPGQIISSSAAGTGYAVQPQIFYAQSGDTIASITSECSSLCTYVVTNPQTITLSASATLSANIQLEFNAGGEWTVNGSSYTLTIPGQVSGTLTKHFAGSASVMLGANNALVPVEWFGAVGNGSTNDTAAIQATINSIAQGQILLQPKSYLTSSALSIARGSIGIQGSVENRAGSTISSSSASADIVDVTGTSSAYVSSGVFQNFILSRGPAPTGTAAGLSLSFAGAVTVDTVDSHDSIRDFYLHAVPSFGTGRISNSNADFFNTAETSGSYYGFYLDSSDGNAESSLRLLNDTAANNTGYYTANMVGMILTGTAINDVMTYGLETAGMSYGQVVEYSGSGLFGASDIHFTKSIHDNCMISCYYISGVSAGDDGSLEITGGWVNSNSATNLIDIESSSGVIVSNVLIGQHSGAVPIDNGIYAANSSNLTIANNSFHYLPVNGITFSGVTSSSISGNTLLGYNASSVSAINLTNSSDYNAITGNSASVWTNGVAFDNTSQNNYGTYTNSSDSTVAHPVADANGANNSIAVQYEAIASASALTGSGSAFSVFQPSLASGNFTYIPFGVAATTNNDANLIFNNVGGPGSASNYAALSIGGSSSGLGIFPNGGASIGGPATGAATAPPANGLLVAGTISAPSISGGTSGNTDLRGHLTLSSGTAAYSFAGTYTVAPTCAATDITSAAVVKASATTTVLTLTGTGTDVLNYICID